MSPAAVVFAIFLIASGLAAFYTTKITGFQPDDLGYSRLAIALSESLGPLLHPVSEGLGRFNQLYMLTIAPVYGSFSNPTAFRIVHVWNALLMASAVVPAYLLAREVVQVRWAAYLAAALVGLCPWMTLASAMVTEIAAYPAFVWAVLAIQRALADPSVSRDLVALLAIGAATFARVQLVALVAVVALAAVTHELGWSLSRRVGTSRRSAVRAGVAALARRHPVLLGVFGAVAVGAVGVRVTSSDALGFYSNTLQGDLFPDGSLFMTRAHLAYIVLGLGIAPAVLAVAWIGANLVRPLGKAAHAFASIVLVAVPVLALQVGSITQRFEPGIVQERYLIYVVPLLIVAMAASFGPRRLIGPTILSGAAVAALVIGARYESSLSAFWFFDSPGMAFYLKVVGAWLHDVAGAVGGDSWTAVQLGAGAVAAVTAALVLLAATAAVRTRLAVVGVAVLAFLVVSTRYDFQQVVYGSYGGKGFGADPIAGRDWVDRHVPEGTTVALLATQQGPTAASREVWWASEFWNRSIRRAYVLGTGPSYVWNPPVQSRVDSATRTVVPATRTESGHVEPEAPPTYVVVPRERSPVQLAGRELARSPDGRLSLLRAQVPYTAVLAVRDASDDGWLRFDRPARITVHPPSRATRCTRVTLTLALPRGAVGPRDYLVRAGRRRVRGTVAPGATRSLAVAACPDTGAPAQVLVSQDRDSADAVGLQLVEARAA